MIGSATPSWLMRRSSVVIASFTVCVRSWRAKGSFILTAKAPADGSTTSQPSRKKSLSRSRMSLTRAGSTPSTLNEVGVSRCIDP